MDLSPLDRSNYLRGLLLLVKREKEISDFGRQMIKEIGKSLGFEKSFCDNALREILFNRYIADDPPLFSELRFAESFLKDCLKLVFSNRQESELNLNYLNNIALTNGLDISWLKKQIECYMDPNIFIPGEYFEVQSLV